jgi:hypothetical protein
MRSHRLRPLAGRLALAALVATAALSAGCFNPFQPLVSSRTTHVEPPPAPTGPREVVLLFKWCWENRDITNYREIFTDDYRFAFALTDSAGNFYRTTPWTREDELTSAQNLFVGGSATEPAASSITLIFDGDLVALPDYRDGKTAAVHQYIQISNLTLTVNRTDGSAYRVTGGAAFFLVRGDSAVIPQELKDRGFGPDKNRWYMAARWPARRADCARDSRPPARRPRRRRGTSWSRGAGSSSSSCHRSRRASRSVGRGLLATRTGEAMRDRRQREVPHGLPGPGLE